MHFDPDKIRARLLAAREEILSVSRTGAEAAGTVELDQTRVGRLSRMDAMQAQAVSAEAMRRREIELLRIASALERIEKGEYGYCVRCDEEIAQGRLEIDPAAPTCVRCASRSETA